MEQQNAMIKTIGKYSYYTDKCLGEGSFGKVFEGYQNETKQKVAIKKVDFKTLEKDKYLEKAIHDQIRILNKFKHPNIVQLHEVLNSKRSLYIIMDYCRDGDLKKYLREKKKVGEQQAFQIMKQIVKGYQQLAKEKTIHRDLKPANILISNGLFKICDFGFSKVIKDPTMALHTCVGSPIYMAPQILEKKNYSAKCDIWSLGIIYYELLHGIVPWTARSEKDLIMKIKNQKVSYQFGSTRLQQMINKMLEVNEQKRASLTDLEMFFGIQEKEFDPNRYNSSQQNSDFNGSQQGFFPNSLRRENSNKQEYNNNNNNNNKLYAQEDTYQNNNNKSVSTVNAKVLNRQYFEEIAFRFFLVTEIKSNLKVLNRYDFPKNAFERYIIMLLSSILCNFERKMPEINRIHEKELISMVMKEYEFYKEFQQDFYSSLQDSYSTCDILKEFEFEDIVNKNYTESNMKRLQNELFKLTQTLLKKLQAEGQALSEYEEKSLLLKITEYILDMVTLNCQQAKTGQSDVESMMLSRWVVLGKERGLEERVKEKIMKIREVRIVTEFY